MSLLLQQLLSDNYTKRKDVQNEITQWMNGDEDDYTHAVTLTFPFLVNDELEADRYIGKFSKFLNKKCHRRAKNDNEKLKMAVVIEGVNSIENIHAHCAIRSPNKFTFEIFEALIKDAWRKSVNNNEAVSDVQQYNDNGWIEYFTKQLTETKTNGISQYCNF